MHTGPEMIGVVHQLGKTMVTCLTPDDDDDNEHVFS
jgi:hypothetical protein